MLFIQANSRWRDQSIRSFKQTIPYYDEIGEIPLCYAQRIPPFHPPK